MPGKAITVGVAVQTLWEENSNRTTAIVINTHAAQILYVLEDSSVSATTGIQIRATGNVVFEKALGWDITKKWYVMASGANTTGIVYEGFGSLPSNNGAGVPPSPAPSPPQYPSGPMGPYQVDP